MRPNIFLATIGRGSNGSNALEVTEDRAAVTAESQDNIIDRVNNVSQYGPSWHYVPGIGVAGTAYAEVPGSATGDLAFSRASSKTRTNAAGAVETIASNVPPHDYRNADGTLSTFPRLNLEPQRTNSIRNSSMVGAVAGTPGTLPTNYAQLGGAGLTRTISIGTENGLPYIDLRFVGTATDSLVRILLENSTQIAAATGQTWTISSYIKNVLISNPADSFTYAMYERTSGGSAVASGFQTITPTSSLQRIAYTRTLNGGATVAFVSIEIQGGLTIGQSYDFTIRIAAPQMELGAYATTWVPTTTAAVTRLADGASKTGVSSLIGQTEGTLFFEFQFQPTSLNQSFAISDGTSANRLDIRLGSNIPAVSIITGGVIQAFIGSAVTMTQGQRVKVACGYKNNDVALYQNGALVGSTSSATIGGTLSRLGFDLNGGQFMNSPISQAAIFPTRLTNDQLAQLTTL